MSEKVRWGVLGASRIGRVKVLPAMQAGQWSEIVAIASRSLDKAEKDAAELRIPKAYGSYEELIADPEIDAIYNPLPNHLHVPWSIKAAEAGKHVLCEKPIGLSTGECLELMEARDRCQVKIGEAFMVRSHPQWLRARELVRSGEIGELRAINAVYSYFKLDRANIRNVPEYGGGGLMDIGCYPIQISRFLAGEEPVSVQAAVERDPEMGIDRLTSGLLQFPWGHSIFTCSTQMVAHQSVQIFGTKARVQLEIPFNAIPGEVSRLWVDDGSDLRGGSKRLEEIPPCDQYTLQGDEFSLAVLGRGEVPTPLEDSLRNMAVIEAVFRSGETGKTEAVVVPSR